MTTSYNIESDLITATFRGPVTLSDVQDLVKSVWGDPRYHLDHDVVIDLSQAILAMTIEEVQEVCDMIADSLDGTFH